MLRVASTPGNLGEEQLLAGLKPGAIHVNTAVNSLAL